MRPLRVCIYGGTHIDGTPSKFISELSYRILKSFPAIIITGGFLHFHKEPAAISTDVAALQGATRYSKENGIALKECFEAWVPDPILDERPDIEGAVRMKADDGIPVHIVQGRTPLGRRLAMVAAVDLVVTISGRKHTEVVVEQSLELGIPILPIPFANGDSETLLTKYSQRIAAAFQSGALDKCLQELSTTFNTDQERGAAAVVELIKTAKLGRCLILQPFNDWHNDKYATIIKPTVASHMFPVRLNELPASEAIYTSFAKAIRTSIAVIADITELNENVMYEIGYAHGLDLIPLLFTREESRLSTLPVYFKTLNVILAPDDEFLKKIINEYLISIKAKREKF